MTATPENKYLFVLPHRVELGQSIAICSDTIAWKPADAWILQWHEGNVWKLAVDSLPKEWKFVVVNTHSKDILRWEDSIQNRKFSDQALAADGGYYIIYCLWDNPEVTIAPFPDENISKVLEEMYKLTAQLENENDTNKAKNFMDKQIAPLQAKEGMGEILRNYLRKHDLEFSHLDPIWITTLLARTSVHEPSLSPEDTKRKYYKTWDRNDACIYTIKDSCRIALVADLGTGNKHHVDTLKAIKLLNPDYIVHLGDIYYSGTEKECKKNFMQPYDEVFPEQGNRPSMWAIPGNHEYICYGKGFKSLLTAKFLGSPDNAQTHFFFCLRSNFIEIIGLDSGFKSHNFKQLPWHPEMGWNTEFEESELVWLKEKIVPTRNDRKTFLLTHHAFTSAFWSKNAVNDKFKQQLTSAGLTLDKVTAWFWGDEHKFLLYNYSGANLQLSGGLLEGRCIGHGAMPEFATNFEYGGVREPLAKDIVKGINLRVDKETNTFARGFALLDIDNNTVSEKYYQVVDGKPEEMHLPCAK